MKPQVKNFDYQPYGYIHALQTYISKLEYSKDKLLFALIIISIFSFIAGSLTGREVNQNEIEKRAKKIKTKTISQQQLELIIFNEIEL